MSEKVVGDPSSFAGSSEHSQQVALFAAVAQYAGEKGELKRLADDIRINALFWREDDKRCGTDREWESAQAAFDEGARLERVANALWLLHAIPNGGTRGGDKRSAMIAGANMKAEGTKTGVSDIMLPVARQGYHGFYIEMKAPGKGRRIGRGGIELTGESDEQIDWGNRVTAEGYLYAVFDSWVKAFRALMWYLGFEHSKAWELPLG